MVLEECAVCCVASAQRCGGCHQIYYCSRQHQKHDWKRHKFDCRPFTVNESPELGRHLLAARDIASGEVLLTESPLLVGPCQVTGPVCLGCLNTLTPPNVVACPRCGWPLCSLACSLALQHQPECRWTNNKKQSKVKLSQFVTPHPTYQCVTALRICYQREANPELWTKLTSLESHCQKRIGSSKYETDRYAVAKFLQRFYKVEQEFSEDEILRICGIIQVNGHEVPLSDPAHVAIYDTASFLEHSCSPNCSKSFSSNGALRVRAVRTIVRGEHISICYTDPLWCTSSRRHHLLETKFFVCKCPRCLDPTELGTYFSALMCLRENCAGYIVPCRTTGDMNNNDGHGSEEWGSCGSCETQLSRDEALARLSTIGHSLSMLKKVDSEACMQFLARWQTSLHPNHYYMTDVRLALAQHYGHASEDRLRCLAPEQLHHKMVLCRQLIGLINLLAPGECRVRGMLLFELHAAIAEEARRAANGINDDPGTFRQKLLQSKQYLMEAADILQYEPEELPEGKMAAQARINLMSVDELLRSLHLSIGDSPS